MVSPAGCMIAPKPVLASHGRHAWPEPQAVLGRNGVQVILTPELLVKSACRHWDGGRSMGQTRVLGVKSRSCWLCACVAAQEDAHSVVLEMEGAPKTGFFGVFDGHGGKEVARFTALYLVRRPGAPLLCSLTSAALDLQCRMLCQLSLRHLSMGSARACASSIVCMFANHQKQ